MIVKTPALYRSLVFWLGSFVLTFLVWAWVDSMKTGTRFSQSMWIEDGGGRELTGYGDGVGFDSGQIVFSWTSATRLEPPLTVHRSPYDFGRFPSVLGGGWFAKPKLVRYQDAHVTMGTIIRRQLHIPMWLTVGSYLVVWGGVMWWWRRRWRRLAGKAGEVC